MLPRAIRRLNFAIPLLTAGIKVGGYGLVLSPKRGESSEVAALDAIRRLPEADQQRIKSMVDWIEAYEAQSPSHGMRPAQDFSRSSNGEASERSVQFTAHRMRG